MADARPASPARPTPISSPASATAASRPGCRSAAPTCSSTRCIRCTRAACSAGAMVPTKRRMHEYGRTSVGKGSTRPIRPNGSNRRPSAGSAARSTGCCRPATSLLRRRLTARRRRRVLAAAGLRAAGMTDYVAIINRFAAGGIIGEMDCVYSSWATRAPGRLQRRADRGAAAARAVPRARHQVGVARAHDRHADGDLSRPRRRPARARRAHRARRRRPDRRRALVQRPARLHAHHRHRARSRSSRCSTTTPTSSSRRSTTTAAMCSS